MILKLLNFPRKYFYAFAKTKESLSHIITDPFPEQLRMLVTPRAADWKSDWHQKSLVSICIYTDLNVRYMLMNNEVDTNSCHSTFSSSTLPSTNTAGFFSCFFCSRVVSKLSAAYLLQKCEIGFCAEHLLSISEEHLLRVELCTNSTTHQFL